MSCASGARGQLVAYEVSDAGFKAVDTVSLDAKPVTDCMVDAESGVAVVVRETANGRGSISLFDATDPRSIQPLGTMDDGLGSISGVAMYKRHVLAVSDARRLDVDQHRGSGPAARSRVHGSRR